MRIALSIAYRIALLLATALLLGALIIAAVNGQWFGRATPSIVIFAMAATPAIIGLLWIRRLGTAEGEAPAWRYRDRR